MIKVTKQQQIEKIRTEKANLRPKLVTAFKVSQKLQQIYRQAENKHLLMKKEYELLDREEKLLAYIPPKVKTKATPKKKKSKDFTAQAKDKAIKALDNLPKELREQILANYKR